jgi:hypothetical protein
MEVGRRKLEDGRRKLEDGRWKLEDGSWKTEDGRRKIKKAGTSPAFFMRKYSNYEFFSERYLSASMAAIHPEPAAVTACR